MRAFSWLLGPLLAVTASTAQGVVLFEDQFDSSLDTSRWDQVVSTGSGAGYVYGTGSTVSESGGVLTVAQDATNAGGGVVSKNIDIAAQGIVTVTMRSYVHYANQYFTGNTVLLGDDGHYLARVTHAHYNSGVTLEGFYLGYPGSGYPVVSPTWNNWIVETLTYDPASGESTYSYLFEGAESTTLSYTSYGPGVVADDTLRVMLLSYGWFTGHSTSFDYVLVEQASAGDVPVPATPLLMVLAAWGVRRSRASRLHGSAEPAVAAGRGGAVRP